MSRRTQLKVPKYAFIKFNCDEKTLQMKTKDLKSSFPFRVGGHVLAPWEGKRLKAKILGLSDDPTVLTDIERKYMASISDRQPKSRKTLPKGSSQSKQSLSRPALKRKASQVLVFNKQTQKRPDFHTHQDTSPKEFTFGGCSSEQLEKIRRVVEGSLMPSSSCNITSPTTPLPSTSTSTIPVPDPYVRLTAVPETNHSFSSPDLNLLPTDLTSHCSNHTESFLDLLNSESDRLPLDYDTYHLTPLSNPSQPASTVPNPSLPEPPVTHPLLDGNGSRDSPGLLPALDDVHRRLDQVMGFVTKVDAVMALLTDLHDKVDMMSSQPKVVTCTIGTQTDSTERGRTPVHATSTDAADEPSPGAPGLAVAAVDTMDTVDTVTVVPIERFTDERVWKLKPSQLDAVVVTRDRLEQLTARITPDDPSESATLDISPEQLSVFRRRSHGPGQLARNILFHGFTLRELYNRNAYGKNFTNGKKKTALNLVKMEELLRLVKLHHDMDNVDKVVTDAVNSALRYLWNRKLALPWLPLDILW